MKVESGYMRLTLRDIDQLVQCGLVVLMQQLRWMQSSLIKRAENSEVQRHTNSRQIGRLTITISNQQVIFFSEHGQTFTVNCSTLSPKVVSGMQEVIFANL